MPNSYNLSYNTWFNGLGGWALIIQLTGPLPKDCSGYINNHNAVLSIACPLNQIENIVNSDSPYYFKQWRDLDRAITNLERHKQVIILEVLTELDENLD